MRYRVDEERQPPTHLPPPSRSLEGEFANLSAKIEQVLQQLDAPIAAAEEALALVRLRLRAKAAAFR
jgi:hypothetical protein